MAITAKVKTEYQVNITSGNNVILEFYDDISILIITIEFPNGSSTVTLESSTNDKDTLNEINSASPVWISSTYGNITANKQIVCRCPNALKISNTGGTTVRISIRGNRA